MTVSHILLNCAADEHELADGTPLILVNPVRAMKRHWAPAGDRSEWHVPFDRAGVVWNTLHEARATARNRDTPAGVNYVMFVRQSGRRRGEAESLRWDEVHFNRENTSASHWFVREQKVGKHVRLPLLSAAIAVLDACERIERNDHVFPSRGKAGHSGTRVRPGLPQILPISWPHRHVHGTAWHFWLSPESAAPA